MRVNQPRLPEGLEMAADPPLMFDAAVRQSALTASATDAPARVTLARGVE